MGDTTASGGATALKLIMASAGSVSQPLASLTIKGYVPTARLEYTVCELKGPPLKLISYGGIPLVASGIMVTIPLSVFPQLTGVVLTVAGSIAIGGFKLIGLDRAVQFSLSVTLKT